MIKKFIILMIVFFMAVSAVHAENETFTDLQHLIHDSKDDTIVLESDYVNDGNSPISISKDVTIDGKNHVLDGNSKSGIIKSTSKVTFKNIVFTNGVSSNYGGALYVSNAVIINCTFINNKAEYGGAVDLRNGKIINSTFIDNEAMVGGAVMQVKSSITNSYFTKNTADSGGAVYQDRSVINSSTFEFNHANFGGGAESFFSDVLNSKFVNNTAKYEGGALYIFYGNVVNSTFINNSAPDGGAMYRIDCNITNCTFQNNTAPEIAPDLDDLINSDSGSAANNGDSLGDVSKSSDLSKTGNPIVLLLLSLAVVFVRIKR